MEDPSVNIAKLKSGDQQEFSRFVNLHKDKVYATCMGFIPNAHDAEDLTQDVFVEIHHSINNFKENARLSTWMYRIAVNKCLEELRRRKQLKRAAFFKGLLGIGSEEVEEQARHFEHPGYLAEEKEKAETLYETIDGLAENQKIAFTLTQIDGHSYIETAEIMGVSISSLESLVFRAKANLKKRLKNKINRD